MDERVEERPLTKVMCVFTSPFAGGVLVTLYRHRQKGTSKKKSLTEDFYCVVKGFKRVSVTSSLVLLIHDFEWLKGLF